MTFTLRIRHVVLGSVLVMLGAAMPLAVLASHEFGDVPTGSTFHGDISRMAGAAITVGCGGGNFCPDDPVTRGQMSAFLNRAASRVTYDTNDYLFDVGADEVLAEVTVRAGNVAGGTALVKLDAQYFTYSGGYDVTGCAPCQFTTNIEQVGTINVSGDSFVNFYNQGAAAIEIAAGGVTWAVAVPTGQNVTFRLMMSKVSGTGLANAKGDLTAVIVPFDGTGNNPTLVASAGSKYQGELPLR